jgi:Tfp pilus assembly protein PilN
MSTKVNLAPEVYQTSQRNKSRKQLAVTICVLLGVVCGGIVLVSLIIMGGQYAAIAKYSSDIQDVQKEIQGIPNLKDAVTVQQHLISIDSLRSQMIYSSRFYEALQSVTPDQLTLTTLTMKDPSNLEIGGAAKTYGTINKLAKALEAVNVQIGPNASTQNQPFFTNVLVTTASSTNTGTVEFKLTAQVSSEVMHGN